MTHQSKHAALPSYGSLEELSICWAEWGQKCTEAHVYKSSPVGNPGVCCHLRETFTGSSPGTSVETNWLFSPSEEFSLIVLGLWNWWVCSGTKGLMAKSKWEACCADLCLLAGLILQIFKLWEILPIQLCVCQTCSLFHRTLVTALRSLLSWGRPTSVCTEGCR